MLANLLLVASIASIAAAYQVDCKGNLGTEWDRHYCDIVNQPEKFQRACVPYLLLPGNASDIYPVRHAKGVIILYHGFSACPDALRPFATELKQDGFIVITPLMPGHGIVPGFGCQMHNTCVRNGTNPSFMPETKEGYMHWVEWTVKMLNEQLDLLPYSAKAPGFQVSSVGLSAGGPISLYALTLPDNPITTTVIVNPYLLVAMPAVDFQVWACQFNAHPDHCMSSNLFPSFINERKDESNSTFILDGITRSIRSTFHGFGVWIIDHTFGSWAGINYVDSLFNAIGIARRTSDSGWMRFGWGQECFDLEESRGGMCEFRIKHLFALQSFAELAIGSSGKIPRDVRIAIMQADRDGPTRRSASLSLVRYLQTRGINISFCHFKNSCTPFNIDHEDNHCGVPHSAFSRGENMVKYPFNMYWERNMFDSIKHYVANPHQSHIGIISGESDLSQCYESYEPITEIPMFNQVGPRYLYAALDRYGMQQ